MGMAATVTLNGNSWASVSTQGDFHLEDHQIFSFIYPCTWRSPRWPSVQFHYLSNCSKLLFSLWELEQVLRSLQGALLAGTCLCDANTCMMIIPCFTFYHQLFDFCCDISVHLLAFVSPVFLCWLSIHSISALFWPIFWPSNLKCLRWETSPSSHNP